MKKYFAYIRVSTVKQGERGSSLAEQKDAIETYAARQGLEIVHWFEETETAAKQGRRRFTEMIKGLKAGRAGGLIIHKIDRSARNLRDWSELGELIDRGVDVRFVSDNLDLMSRGGRLSADIQAVVAADFIRNLREEVRKGIYGRLKQGLYPFAAPLGYRDNGGGVAKTIDPATGPLVRELFERYATGTLSFEALRQEMAQKGLRARSGAALSRGKIGDILNNPFYMGVIRLRSTGETFAGRHEPLISEAVYSRVQNILHGRTVPKARRHRYLFRQMIRCKSCGRRTLTGERQKGFVYYRCHECGGRAWREERLEQEVLATIRTTRLSEADIRELRELVEEDMRSGKDHQERSIEALSLSIARADERLTRLTDLLIDGTIDEIAHHSRREKLLLERQGLIDARDSAKKQPPLGTLFAKFERENRELLRYEILTDDEKRELLDIVGSNFSVCGENIVFALRSPYREIAKSLETDTCGPYRDDLRTTRPRIFSILKTIVEERPHEAPYPP